MIFIDLWCRSRWPGEDDFAFRSARLALGHDAIIFMDNCVFYYSMKNDLIWLLVECKHALVNNVSIVSESTRLWLTSPSCQRGRPSLREWFASRAATIPRSTLTTTLCECFLCQVQTKPTLTESLDLRARFQFSQWIFLWFRQQFLSWTIDAGDD